MRSFVRQVVSRNLFSGVRTRMFSQAGSNAASAISGDRVTFPREGVDIKLNWQLAQHYITPSVDVKRNSVRGGEASSNYSNASNLLTVGSKELSQAKFQDAHRKIAKAFARASTLFVEDGEIEGQPIRVVTASEEAARAARSSLRPARSSDVALTVLIPENGEGLEASYLNTKSQLLLTPSANASTLGQAVSALLKR